MDAPETNRVANSTTPTDSQVPQFNNGLWVLGFSIENQAGSPSIIVFTESGFLTDAGRLLQCPPPHRESGAGLHPLDLGRIAFDLVAVE